jgi:lysophospholipase
MLDTLPPRFQPPDHWQTETFRGADGHLLYTGFNKLSDQAGSVVFLEGLAEFTQKYYEAAHDMEKRRLSTYVFDWQGQGLSYRPLRDTPQRRTSKGFHHDVADLAVFMNEYVLPNTSGKPVVFVGHSMGCNPGTRYVHDHPDHVQAMACSTPMYGIQALEKIPGIIRKPILKYKNRTAPNEYADNGDYTPDQRSGTAQLEFSSDPERSALHGLWYDADPHLLHGGPTWSWLYHADQSCDLIMSPGYLEAIKTPFMLAMAGQEHLVSNKRIREATRRLPNASLREFPTGKHELLQESDAIRNVFWQDFDALTAPFIQ